jgi:hypothetical protein
MMRLLACLGGLHAPFPLALAAAVMCLATAGCCWKRAGGTPRASAARVSEREREREPEHEPAPEPASFPDEPLVVEFHRIRPIAPRSGDSPRSVDLGYEDWDELISGDRPTAEERAEWYDAYVASAHAADAIREAFFPGLQVDDPRVRIVPTDGGCVLVKGPPSVQARVKAFIRRCLLPHPEPGRDPEPEPR